MQQCLPNINFRKSARAFLCVALLLAACEQTTGGRTSAACPLGEPASRYTLSRLDSNNYRLTVAECVENVSKDEFSAAKLGGKNIVAIELPATLQTIGERAFANHKNVRELRIPQNVADIGKQAFLEVGADVPNGIALSFGGSQSRLINIGESAFRASGVKQLPPLPNRLQTIDSNAFLDSSLDKNTSVTIPKSVRKIGDAAFCSTSFSFLPSENKRVLTILSDDIELGKTLFSPPMNTGGLFPRANPFKEIRLPKKIYDSYNDSQNSLRQIFGNAVGSGYADLNGNAY